MDTNIFLFSETLRQKKDKASCHSLDGPYCSILTGESLSDRLETENKKYLEILAGTEGYFQKRGAQILEAKKNYDIKERKNWKEEFMFVDKSRKLLDEALYPKIYRREFSFRFTFQTFNITQVEQYFDSVVDFEFDISKFWIVEAYDLFRKTMNFKEDLLIYCSFDNFWIPPMSLMNYEKYSTKEKRQLKGNKFSNWHLDSEVDKDYIKWGDTLPKNEFVFTKDTQATISFSIPVFFRFVFARVAYHRHQNLHETNLPSDNFMSGNNHVDNKDEGLGSSYIQLKLNGEIIKEWTVYFTRENTWRRYTFENLEIGDQWFIDEIVFGPDLEIDNIDLFFNYRLVEDSIEAYTKYIKDRIERKRLERQKLLTDK